MFLVETIKGWLNDENAPRAQDICIAARTGALLSERYQPLLEEAGIETTIVKTDEDTKKDGGVRLATMHRTKGLEFTRVIVAGVHEGTVPFALPEHRVADKAAEVAHQAGERRLLYVAATRARDALVVTGFGKRSPLL